MGVTIASVLQPGWSRRDKTKEVRMPAEVESMFSVREVPWHGLGEIVDDKLTAAEALQVGGLDWDVELRPLKAYLGHDARPQYVTVEDRFGVVRSTDNSVLGVVGGTYVPFQNRDAFVFFDNLVDNGEAKYDTAGSLRKGKWVWLTAKMPETVLIGGEDAIDVYLLLSTSHDGSRSITASVTPVRVVCQNTLNMAQKAAKRKWSVRHLSTAGQRLEEARQALGMTFKYVDAFEVKATELLSQSMVDQEFTKLVEGILPDRPRTPQVIEELRFAFNESPTLDNIKGTKWAAYNAVAEYFDWLREPRSAEAQVTAIWDGVAMKMKDKALAALSA